MKAKLVKFEIDPHRTALLVVDMQHGFLAPESPMSRAAGLEMIPRLNSLIKACRASGLAVVFTRQAFKRDFSDVGLYPEFFPGPPEDYFFVEGRLEAEIYAGMDLTEADTIVSKTTFSAFVGTGLHDWLRERDIDTVIIAGVDVHVCCEATARDARHLNLRVIFLSDGTATGDRADYGWGASTAAEMQRHVLSRLALGYAEVATVSDVMARLGAAETTA